MLFSVCAQPNRSFTTFVHMRRKKHRNRKNSKLFLHIIASKGMANLIHFFSLFNVHIVLQFPDCWMCFVSKRMSVSVIFFIYTRLHSYLRKRPPMPVPESFTLHSVEHNAIHDIKRQACLGISTQRASVMITDLRKQRLMETWPARILFSHN